MSKYLSMLPSKTSIRKEILQPVLIIVASILLAIVLQSLIVKAQVKVFEKGAEYQKIQETVSLLHATDDDLTRLVRMYLVTKDKRLIDYYQQIRDMREGKRPWPKDYVTHWTKMIANPEYEYQLGKRIPLENNIHNLPLDYSYQELLTTAKSVSVQLAEMQKLAIAEFDNGNVSRAHNIMYGEEYFQAKSYFVFLIDQVLATSDQVITQELDEFKNYENYLSVAMLVVFFVMALYVGSRALILLANISSDITVFNQWAKAIGRGDFKFLAKGFSPYNELIPLKNNIQLLSMEIESSIQKYKKLSLIDSLTGLYNRRAFSARLDEEIAKVYRYSTDCHLILMDVDHFKTVNDTYGHDVGDIVLKTISSELKSNSRVEDMVCRVGGEEFAIICPNVSRNNALYFAERLRVLIEACSITYDGDKELKVTVSIGFVSLEPSLSAQQVIKQADILLYDAKRQGRNRVCADGIEIAPKITQALNL